MQRHRVNEQAVGVVTLVAVVVACLTDAAPTGSRVIDVVIVGVSVAVTVWAAGTAPWWTISILAAAAVALSTTWITIPVALGALVASWWVGSERRDLSVQRSVITAVACVVLLSSDVVGFHGLSALIGIGASLPLLVLGLRRRRNRVSRSIPVGFAVVGVAAVAATIGTGMGARAAQDDLESGQARATEAIASVERGDYLEASASFATASVEFERAHDSLTTPWSAAGSAVPVVAQNRRAVTDLADRAASASEALAAALAVVDPEQLRLEGGRLDLDVVAILGAPFETIRAELTALDESIESIGSPWLVEPIETRLADLREDLDANRPGLDAAVDAVALAPRLLGGEGERRYFVAVTTPAEARGIAGFMGNWIELSANEGRLSIARSGRTRDLNRAGDDERTVTGPTDFLDQYGRFGFDSGGDGATAADPWSNITLSADFASTAQVIAELYPQSGGGEVDGVFALDPEVIGALLGYTGPVTVDGSDVSLDSSNVVDFLLVDQYAAEDDDARVDLLQDVSEEVIARIFAGALPNPAVVARDLAPLTRESRLLGWSADPEEQQLFRDIGLSGELPTLDGGDGLGVVFTNVGANKLDAYLGRQVSYRSTVDEETGAVNGTAVITVTNDAPTSGFLEGAIGNYAGDPVGTNRTRLSVFSALPVVDAEVDGAPVSMRVGTEGGWTVNSLTLAIPPGGTLEVAIDFAGELPSAAPGAHRLVAFTQP
ncbi:MAG: DUF4012 domain-containing protein, partial [Ilumatobacter sp.]